MYLLNLDVFAKQHYQEKTFILDKNNERPDWMTDLKHTDTAWQKDAYKRNLCYMYSFV